MGGGEQTTHNDSILDGLLVRRLRNGQERRGGGGAKDFSIFFSLTLIPEREKKGFPVDSDIDDLRGGGGSNVKKKTPWRCPSFQDNRSEHGNEVVKNKVGGRVWKKLSVNVRKEEQEEERPNNNNQ